MIKRTDARLLEQILGKHLKKMQTIYTDFLKNSEQASTKLTSLQADGAVKVWLSECNLVAKDLTAAWDIDALLVKPVQRITRYQLLLAQIFEHTSEDHPDWQALRVTVEELASLLKNIDDLKKRDPDGWEDCWPKAKGVGCSHWHC